MPISPAVTKESVEVVSNLHVVEGVFDVSDIESEATRRGSGEANLSCSDAVGKRKESPDAVSNLHVVEGVFDVSDIEGGQTAPRLQ